MKAYALYHPKHGFLEWAGQYWADMDDWPDDRPDWPFDPVVKVSAEPSIRKLYASPLTAQRSIESQRVWENEEGKVLPKGLGRCVIRSPRCPYPKIAEFPLDEVEIKEVQINW